MIEDIRGAASGFGVRWTVLCGLGLAGGLAVGLGLAAPVEAVVGMMLVTPVILALAGSMFGAAQWLALGRSPQLGASWVGTSGIGLGIGMTIGIVLVEMLGQALTGEPMRLQALDMLGRLGGLTFVGAFAGLGLGAAQWLALRPAAPIARRWIVLCVAGFGAGLPAGSLAAELVGGLQSAVGFAAFLGVAGLTLGVFTARGGAAIAAGLAPRRAD
ncbi:MAG: hypothetical protein OXH08_00530 [Gammaproteobacteria bacterium]|nr:hypothetical protein [Gammaproteobacteria bacterium]MDE0650237.1 hypothetical protein [Gammaproteobacteria bacterium]